MQKSTHSVLSKLYCRTKKIVDKRIKYVPVSGKRRTAQRDNDSLRQMN
jgi:hypothetical protein